MAHYNPSEIQEYKDDDYGTGRKLINPKRKESCILSHTGTVIYKGCLLKKVHSALINKKRTTYFKCRNMRTPYKIQGVCVFSARIINFPENLELQIIHDHSPNCTYGKENDNSRGQQQEKVKVKRREKKRKVNVKEIKNLHEKEPFFQSDVETILISHEFPKQIDFNQQYQIYDINDNVSRNAIDLQNLNIQLFSKVEKSLEDKINQCYLNIMNI
jgi:hypothetical protein